MSNIIEKSKKIPGLGVILALLTGVGAATQSFATVMMVNVNPIVALLYASILQALVYALVSIKFGITPIPARSDNWLLLGRFLAGFTSFSTILYALRYMNFSDVNTIAFSSPIFVAPLAAIFLKEKCGPFQIVAIFVAISGIVLIARPSFIFTDDDVHSLAFDSNSYLIGTGLSIIGSLSVAVLILCLRRIRDTQLITIVVLYSYFCCFACLLLIGILKYGFKQEVRILTVC